jgi:energy-coupling factor transporter ATP-binding protein EcfA2
MNKLINKYLTAMDFFVNFNINESFEETIKSRHRDDFSYANFSEGEKQKIDLSLLFTWRQIAKMKNSTNTNLLILDEVFDSSLDTASVDLLMALIRDLSSETNVFVISHKSDQMFDRFRSVIKFVKKNNFSVIES